MVATEVPLTTAAAFWSWDNVNFLNNTAQNEAATTDGTGNGGALYISAATAVTLTNTTFTNNTAGGSGGAIYVTVADALGHVYAITNGVFTLNKANGFAADAGGGAIYAQTDSDVTDIIQIGNAQFITNSAPKGVGGAIALSTGQIAYVDPAFPLAGGVIGSHFEGNSAGGDATANTKGGSGGAIYANNGHLTVVQSSFHANSSTKGSGGGIYFFDASGSLTPKLSVVNSTFNANNADQAGGGIANPDANSALDLRNVTLAGNGAAGNTSAGNTAVGGGNFYNGNGYAFSANFARVLVANSIFDAPSTGSNCAGQRFVENGPNLQNGDSSCISVPPGTAKPAPGEIDAITSVISGDPKLGSATIHLLAANSQPATNPFVLTMAPDTNQSAALNAGSNSICSSGPVLNQDGTGAIPFRPYGDANCDLGAYEQGATTPVQLQSFSVD
jgi:predicted outer membrane repeat protein